MRVYIWDFTHDRYYPVLTSENATVKRLLSQVVPQIARERGPGRQMVAYLQRTGEQLAASVEGRYVRKGGKSTTTISLHPWQTLAAAGVVENEILVLCYFIQPGAKAVVLQDRLASEYESLKELQSKSDLFRFEAIEGNPPRKYRVTFECTGLMLHPVTKKPFLTANHVMEIYLPAGEAGYPYEAPYVTCLTPHFHPNISPENNMVCLGVERNWDSSLDIAWLVAHLADMITFRIYGVAQPYNLEATKWAEANKEKFPFDNRSFFKEWETTSIHNEHGKDAAISFEEPIEFVAKTQPEKKTTRKRPATGTNVKSTKKQTPAKKKQAPAKKK